MANNEQKPTIAVPKFFKDYNKGLDKFKSNLENLKKQAEVNNDAKKRLDEINRSMIFINNENGDGEAIYANGKFYGAGGGDIISSDSTIGVSYDEKTRVTDLSTHSDIVKIGQGPEGAIEGEPAFKVTNPIGNYETGEKIILEQDSIYKVLYNILNKTELPTTTRPSVTLGGIVEKTYEVGTTISGTLTSTYKDGTFTGKYHDDTKEWNKNETFAAGCKDEAPVYSGPNVNTSTGAYSYTFTKPETITYDVNVKYSESTVKPKDSVGALAPVNINSGSDSDPKQVSSAYKCFYGNTIADSLTEAGAKVIGDVSELKNSGSIWLLNNPIISTLQSNPDNKYFSIVVALPVGWEVYEVTNGAGVKEPANFIQQTETITRNGETYNVFYKLFSSSVSSVTKYTDIKIRKVK